MKNKIVFAILFSCIIYTGYGQNTLRSTDDIGRVALVPAIVSNSSIPSYASSLVKSKLIQVITQCGLGGSSYDQRFIITANIVETSKEITTTAPPMVALELSTTLYIGDVATGNLYSSCPLSLSKGVGANETKAYMSAIKAINMQNPEVRDFIEEGKTKIVEYYNSQIDFIIADAMAQADQEHFDDAISILFSVPEVCKEAYLKAMDTVAGVYQRKIDKEGAILLNIATQAWNANQSYDGAEEVATYLAKVHPLSSSFTGACKLSDLIAARIKEIDDRAWDFRMRQYDDKQNVLNKQVDNAHEERLSMISAAKEVGIARCSQPITYNLNHITWW